MGQRSPCFGVIEGGHRGGSRNSLRGGEVLGQNSSKGGGGGLGSRSVGIFIY